MPAITVRAGRRRRCRSFTRLHGYRFRAQVVNEHLRTATVTEEIQHNTPSVNETVVTGYTECAPRVQWRERRHEPSTSSQIPTRATDCRHETATKHERSRRVARAVSKRQLLLRMFLAWARQTVTYSDGQCDYPAFRI